jgi:hypothetical protein
MGGQGPPLTELTGPQRRAQLVSRSGVTLVSGIASMNESYLLPVIVDVPDIQQAAFEKLRREAGAAVRQG